MPTTQQTCLSPKGVGWGTLILPLLLWLPVLSLRAHSTSNSIVMLDFQLDKVTAELTLSMSELELACKQPLMASPAEVGTRDCLALRAYILAHVRPVTPDGRDWNVEINDMKVLLGQAQPDLLVQLSLRPPPGAPLRRFALNYSIICQEVTSHAAMVSVRNDWNSATFSDQPRFLGVVQYAATTLQIDRTRGSFWLGFGSVMLLGMRHIAGGFDHLLFLFVLLLPTPLLAQDGLWGRCRGLRGSFVQLLKIVTAFTIGHSLTLIVGGLGWLRLPARPVEVLIAVSILVSAVHAIRPWFAGRETWIAGSFGLVHGLAFASGIAAFGFSPWHLAMTILGFNLGIELMQLAAVVAIVPSLILLSHHRAYTPVRLAGATLAAVAAVLWIGLRPLATN